MNILNQQIFENKEAAALPGLLESGGLPALVSGLSGVHRVNLAAALFERLRSLGVPQAQLDTVCTPIGFDLGGETPEELAIAILGQILLVKNRGRSALRAETEENT